MGNVYVPDETWLVCTSGMNKKQIRVTSQSTVKNQNKYLATIDDRTGGNFVCSKMVIAGALIGAAVGALIFFTGGAAAVALGSAMAMGAAAGAATGLAAAISLPICAMTTLMYDWMPVHQNVEFENKKALIGSSQLDCLFGGKIIICYSSEYADSIINKNRVNTLRDTVVIIGLSYFGGSLAQGVWQGSTALWNSFKAKDYLSIVLGATVVGGNYGAGKFYDYLKTRQIPFTDTNINNLINPDNQESTGSLVYNDITTPEAGLPGSVSEIDNVNAQVGYNSNTQTTSVSQNRTTIITPNGEVILPGTRIQQSSSSQGISYSTTRPNAPTASTGVHVSSSSSSSSIYHSPAITEASHTSSSTNLNIQTNLPKQLASSVGKGLLENVIKDIGDFVTLNLIANYGDDEIIKSFTENELTAVKGINVVEDEF